MGGYVLVPIVHIYGPRKCASSSARAAHGRTSPPIATATSTTSTSSTARAPGELPDLELHVVVGDPTGRARRPRCGASRWDVVDAAAEPAAMRSRADARSRRRVRARVHVGNDERPQGRDAHAPHAARRAVAHRCVDHARRAEPDGIAGHARDRHARRGARADGAGRRHPPHRPLGSGPRARGHARGRRRRGNRRVGVPREHARPSRFHARARTAHPARRARRRAGPGRARGAGRRARHRDRAGLRIDRAPVGHRARSFDDPADKRHGTDGRPHARRRDPAAWTTTASTSRPASRARSGRAAPTCAPATPIPRSPRPRSTPTVGTARATWASSTPTASSRSPTG